MKGDLAAPLVGPFPMHPSGLGSGPWVRCLALLALALCLATPPASSQRKKPSVAPNDPSLCPHTGGKAELLAAAGIVSMGGFPFGASDTAAIDRAYPLLRILWIETAFTRIGFALGEYSVRNDERDKIDGELLELAKVLPNVPRRPRTLEPWLRAHLFAMRAERHVARIMEVLQVEPGDFPDGTRPWNMQGKYMGEGPYLGQKSKYEILILPSQVAVKQFLSDQFGLQTQMTQRWNVRDRGALMLVIPADQTITQRDTGLHCHMVFNLTTNLLDGYKLYAYELPVWLREGLAHAMEREIDPRYNSFTFSEGAVSEPIRKTDWLAEVRKLVRSGSAPRLAELVNIDAYGDLEARHHLVAWSMTDYLLRVHPDAYAKIQDDLNGRVNAQGATDGSNIKDAHRDAFRRHLSMSYAELDQAWAAWVQSPAAGGKGSGTGGDEDPARPGDGPGVPPEGPPVPPRR